jgi:hypothetical protein
LAFLIVKSQGFQFIKTQILPFSSCHAGSIGCAKLKEMSAAIFVKSKHKCCLLVVVILEGSGQILVEYSNKYQI